MALKDVLNTFKNPQNMVTGPVDRYLLSLSQIKSDRRRFCYHPSSLGKCPRKVQLDFLESPCTNMIKPQTRFIFAVGHALQEVYVQFMIAAGLFTREDIERPMHNYDLNIHGHTDAYCPTKKWGLDIKTTRDPVVMFTENGRVETPFKDLKEPHPEYVWQMQAYMMCDDDATHYQIVYINKNDQSVKEFHIPRDEEKINVLKQRIADIDQANADRCLVPRPDGYLPTRYPCMWCDHKETCWDDSATVDFSIIEMIEQGKIDVTTGRVLEGVEDELL